jgi:hypothetical protein
LRTGIPLQSFDRYEMLVQLEREGWSWRRSGRAQEQTEYKPGGAKVLDIVLRSSFSLCFWDSFMCLCSDPMILRSRNTV